MIQDLFSFYFRNHRKGSRFPLQETLHRLNILPVSDIGEADEIDSVPDAKEKVFSILLGKSRSKNRPCWKIDSLLRGEHSSHHNPAFDVFAIASQYFKCDRPVRKKDGIPGSHLLWERGIAYGNLPLITQNLPPRQEKFFSLFQLDAAFLHFADPDFGPRQILKDGNRLLPLIRNLSKGLNLFQMLFLRPMRKVETGHIHPGLDQSLQNVRRFARRRSEE